MKFKFQRTARAALPIVALLAVVACGGSASVAPRPTSTEVVAQSQTTANSPTPQAASPTPKPEVVSDLPFPVGDPAVGSGIFARTCAVCHGEAGSGDPGLAPGLTSDGHASHHPDRQIREWIANGKLGLGANMPPYGDRLNEQDISDVTAYVKSLWTQEQREVQLGVSLRYEEGYRKYR